MNRIIDSHQHFWKLSRNDYDWLTPDLKSLYRDFLPNDLLPTLQQCKIDGTIVVQAAATTDETSYLLKLAQENPFILGVVGWVDMLAHDAPDTIAQFAAVDKFCGIRPMIQDISDVDWMLKKELVPSFSALEQLNLTFDALVHPKHLLNLIKLGDRHPDLKIVVDHGAKPQIKSGAFASWANDVKQVSTHPGIYCKLSGLLTEAGPQASWESLQPYVEHLFSCFGYHRMMWGSDFPVLNLASDYHVWFEMCKNYIKPFGNEAYDCVFGKVAAEFYNV